VGIPNWFVVLALFVFGLVFGSFGNVVIWRLPRGESLSQPPSHCPTCGGRIPWYDNVPLVSWVALRGRCRGCGSRISPRYPLVELLGGVLWAAAGWQFGLTAQLPAAMIFYYLLLLLAFIDLDTRRLPNSLVGLLAACGLMGAVFSQVTGIASVPLASAGGGLLSQPLVSALVGAVASAGLALVIALVYQRMRKTEGFGMGDVKLLAAIGIFLGPFGLMVFFLGSAMGAIWGLVAARSTGRSIRAAFPFGPFLAIAAVLVTMGGPAVWAWYVTLVTGG